MSDCDHHHHQKKKRVTVAVACESCHKSKRTCSSFRPCARCVRLGKADSCVDHTPPMRAARGTPPMSPMVGGGLTPVAEPTAAPLPCFAPPPDSVTVSPAGSERLPKRPRSFETTASLSTESWQLDSPDSVLTLSPRTAGDSELSTVNFEEQHAELRMRLDQLPLIQVPEGVDPTSFRLELVRLLARDCHGEYRGLMFTGVEAYVKAFVPYLGDLALDSPSLQKCVTGAEHLATVLVRANLDSAAETPPSATRLAAQQSMAMSRWVVHNAHTPATFTMFDCTGATWKPAVPIANSSLSNVLGFRAQELSGALAEGSHLFVHPEDTVQRAIAIVHLIAQRGRAGSRRHRLVHKTGLSVPVVESWSIEYCRESGLPVSMSSVFSAA